MTATRTAAFPRSPRTPAAKSKSVKLPAEQDGAQSGPGGNPVSEKPQGALSPSLFDSLQQRASQLKALLGSLQVSNGTRTPDADNGPYTVASSYNSVGARDSVQASSAVDMTSTAALLQPLTMPAKTSTGLKPDGNIHPRAASPAPATGATHYGVASRVRAGSWSSGVRGGEAGPSWQRVTQGTTHGKAQGKAKEAVSCSKILRDGALDKHRPAFGGVEQHGQGAPRPPSQRSGTVLAPQPQSNVHASNHYAAGAVQRRSASEGGGAPLMPTAAAMQRSPARMLPGPWSSPALQPQQAGRTTAESTQANISVAATVNRGAESVTTAEAAGTITTATPAALPAYIPSSVAPSGSSNPTVHRPHPPTVPLQRTSSWSASGGIRRSSTGGRYSDGGRASGDPQLAATAAAPAEPSHTPPLPPPAPDPAQPMQARLSRSCSPSPPCSSGGGAGSSSWQLQSHEVAAVPSRLSQLQDGSAAPPSPPPISQKCSAPKHPVSGGHAAMAVAAQQAQRPPQGIASKGNDGGMGHVEDNPVNKQQLRDPGLQLNGLAAALALAQEPPPRSQAAQELSAILSTLAAVSAPAAAVVDFLQSGESPQLRSLDAMPNVGVLSGELYEGQHRSRGDIRGGGSSDGAVATSACTVPYGYGSGMTVMTYGCNREKEEQPRSDANAAGAGTAPADSETALAQALAVARASALAAFLRPEARLYRPRASGFGTARSGSSSPVARGGGGRRLAISGQVFAGVPAFAAPFSGRDGTARSPRCGYASSGIDSLHSPSARSSRYERLLMLQEATAGARPQCGEGSTAGAPGPEFMRRNAVLLKKRQAWAATKRRDSADSADSGHSPGKVPPQHHHNEQGHRRRSSSAWDSVYMDVSEPVLAAPEGTAAASQRRTSSGSGAAQPPPRRLGDLQHWADRRERRLAVLREERQAEERARADAQLTFKPTIGERSRRLAKLARSRASYVPLPGSSPLPPPRTATLPQPSSAAASAGNAIAQPPRISTAQTCATSTGGAVMTSTLPARPGIGPHPDNNSNDRLQRMSSVSAPRARPCSAVVAATSIGGTSIRSNVRQSISVTISNDDLLNTLRGARPWHKGNPGSAVEASTGGASIKVTSMGGAMPGGGRGSGKSKVQLGVGAGAARNNRLLDRYAAGAGGCDDPLVGSVADAIKDAKVALKLRPAPSRRPQPLAQQYSQADVDVRPRPRGRKLSALHSSQSQAVRASFARGRGRSISMSGLAPAVGGRRQRASAAATTTSAAAAITSAAASGHEDPHSTHANHARRLSAPLGLWGSPQQHSPNAYTHGGSGWPSFPPSPLQGESCRHGLLKAVLSGVEADGGSGEMRVAMGCNVAPPSGVIAGDMSYGSPEVNHESVGSGDGLIHMVRRTLDMLSGVGGSSGSGGSLPVRTSRRQLVLAGGGLGFGSEVSGSGGATTVAPTAAGSRLQFASTSDDSSPFRGRVAGSPAFMMLHTGGDPANGSDALSLSAAVGTATTVVDPSDTLIHVPIGGRLSAPGAGDGLAAPTAPGSYPVGDFCYGSLTSSPTSSYKSVPYDAGSNNVVLSASPPAISNLAAGVHGQVLISDSASPYFFPNTDATSARDSASDAESTRAAAEEYVATASFSPGAATHSLDSTDIPLSLAVVAEQSCLPSALLQGVRFTKILGHQLAASLQQSMHTSLSAECAPAALEMARAAEELTEAAGGYLHATSTTAAVYKYSIVRPTSGCSARMDIAEIHSADASADIDGLCLNLVDMDSSKRPLMSYHGTSDKVGLACFKRQAAMYATAALVKTSAFGRCSSCGNGADDPTAPAAATGAAIPKPHGDTAAPQTGEEEKVLEPDGQTLAREGIALVAKGRHRGATEEDPLSALQSLIWKMKHLADECDAVDCGSGSFRGCAASSSSGGGSGSGEGRGSGGGGSGNAGPEEPALLELGCDSSGGDVKAAPTAASTELDNDPERANSAKVDLIAASSAPLDSGAELSSSADCSTALSPVTLYTSGAVAATPEATALERCPEQDASIHPKLSEGSSSSGGCGPAIAPSEPLTLELLVQRAEQLRASALSASSMSHSCSPVSASPSSRLAGVSASQHTSPYSLHPERSQPEYAAAPVSPMQPLRCSPSSRATSRSAGSGTLGSSLWWTAGSGAVAAVTAAIRSTGSGCCRSGPGDAGTEFVFPRLRSESMVVAPVPVVGGTVAGGVRALKLVPMGGRSSPEVVMAGPVGPAGRGGSGRTPPEDEMAQEISLAGGFDQLPTNDKMSPRRPMPAPLVAAAEQLAAASAQQPRYSVWSLVDHLPAAAAAVTSATAAPSGVRSSTIAGLEPVHNATASAATSIFTTVLTGTDATTAGSTETAPSKVQDDSGDDGLSGGGSLAALHSLIRQVAHL